MNDKKPLQFKIYDYIKPFKMEGFDIDLKGTASLKSQLYYSDYDILNVGESWEKFEEKFKKLLKSLSLKPNYFFKELKIQYNDGTKEKFYKLEDVKLKVDYSKVDFIKVDYYIIDEGRIREISAIYTTNIFKLETFIINMSNDIKTLLDEGNYFKALKRYFILLIQFGEDKKLNDKGYAVLNSLRNFFNGVFGRLYEKTAILKTLRDFKSQYGDENIIRQTLRSVNVPLKANLDSEINKMKTKYNNEALKKFDYLF
jgi:hypothetical protein